MRLVTHALLAAMLWAPLVSAEPPPLAVPGEVRPELTNADQSALAGFEQERITHITFHHEGFAGDDADLFRRASAAREKQSIGERVRNINHYHATQAGLGMFAYHYAVDKAGNIAKGRPVRLKPATRSRTYDTGRLADFDGHFAVVALGDFNHEQLTPAGRMAYVRVMSEAQRAYRVPTARVLPHQHYASTACPGKHILDEAEALQKMVFVYSLQAVLRARDCLDDAPDGSWGPKTKQALARLLMRNADVLEARGADDAALFEILERPQVVCPQGG